MHLFKPSAASCSPEVTSTIPNIHLRLYKTTKSNNLKFRSTNKRHLPKCPPGSSLLTSPLTVATFATFPILIRLFELVIAQAALALATALAAPVALAEYVLLLFQVILLTNPLTSAAAALKSRRPHIEHGEMSFSRPKSAIPTRMCELLIEWGTRK